MPSFLSNKWFLVAVAAFVGMVLERKMGALTKVGLGTFIAPSA
jgi:hypothetical protein